MKVETVEVTRPDGEKIVVNADEAADYKTVVNADEAADYKTEKASEDEAALEKDEAALETPKSRKRGGK